MTDIYEERWNSYPESYKEYVRKIHKDNHDMKINMEKSGWKDVSITPSTMTFNEWKKDNNYE